VSLHQSPKCGEEQERLNKGIPDTPISAAPLDGVTLALGAAHRRNLELSEHDFLPDTGAHFALTRPFGSVSCSPLT
jgi:hypothetical protein